MDGAAGAAPQDSLHCELKQVADQIAVLEKELAELEGRGPNFRRTGALDRDTFVLPEPENGAKGKAPGPGSEYVFGKSAQHYAPYRALRSNLIGMSFSGGGIRSATFNLGVLQALSDLDLLRRIDYLSAVSGGSYIAAWLAAWARRQEDGILRVQRWLSPIRSPHPEDKCVEPIKFLRRYSNYLAPRTGLASADTWAGVSIWLRNTLLNQFTLVLVFLVALLVPRTLLSASVYPVSYMTLFWWMAVVLFFCSTVIGLNLRSFGSARANTTWLRSTVAVQLFVVLVGMCVPSLLGTFAAINLIRTGGFTFTSVWSALAIIFSVGLCWAGLLGEVYRCYTTSRAAGVWARIKAVLLLLLFSGIGGTVAAAITVLTLKIITGWNALAITSRYLIEGRLIVFGPLTLLLLLSSAATIQIGLLGRSFPDERREWWSRVGGLLLLYGCGWTILAGIALYGPLLIGQLFQYRIAAVFAGILWVVHTVTGLQLGRSPASSAVSQPSWGWQKIVMLVAPPLFIVGVLLLLSYGLQRLLSWWYLGSVAAGGLLSTDYWCMMSAPVAGHLAVIGVVMAVISLIWASRIDVNEFSMHHFYRNRLVRCYLGASHPDRVPNPFTGFDVEDDLQLTELQNTGPEDSQPKKEESKLKNVDPYVGPYLIVNSALNVVAGSELAWQERKAESFMFSPLYSGYENSRIDGRKSRLQDEGYRPTYAYAYPENYGPSLGTAVAISGAAASPNMGYHSSMALSFLMTLFNVRLGWWMGNTRHPDRWRKSSPGNGLLYMLNELLGRTKDVSRYINLSDGGHFENLGIYELIRRRCTYIIVCDSEEDKSYTFGGLGGAVRKCRTDFGVDIDIDVENLRPVQVDGVVRAHCAAGKIRYPGEHWGRLLYIKASITADESVDVREYGWRAPAFPHQTTADQFFSESQFESYRALGRHVATSVLGPSGASTAADMFDHLEALWTTDPPGAPEFGPRHSAGYAALLDELAEHPTLQRLDPVFFLTPPAAGRREDHYAFASMIEFIHDVLRDTGLDTRFYHPRLAGWITTFRQWARDPEFQRAWQVVRCKYDSRFRKFVDVRLVERVDP